MDTMWLREALFGGMTCNGFKLGTVLNMGWFWSRVSGCSVLYRGCSMEAIDFARILSVAKPDAEESSPPSYIQHEEAAVYFYAVRRTNNCGDQEYGLNASVKVLIDSDGNLAPRQSNNIFRAGAKQVAGSKVQLVWHYCSLEQESEPASFKVYYDGGTGQVDYENPLAVISCAGRRFYSYTTNTLSADRYLFCIRAKDAAGTENKSFAQVEVQLEAECPDAVDILSVGPV